MILKEIVVNEDKNILDKMNIAILIDDKQGQIEFANTKLCKLFGYEINDLLKLDDYALVHPNDREMVKQYHHERIENKVDIPGKYDLRGVTRNGDTIYLSVLSLPRVNDKKETTGTINYIWDITSTKNIEKSLIEREKELIQSELELKGILESTADGILAVDNNGKVITTNEKFSKLWRIPKEILDSGDDDMLLSHVLDQLLDPEQFLSKVKELYNSKERDFDTLHFKDGRIFERYSRPLLVGEENFGRIWSFRDITGKMQSEKALKESETKFRSLIVNSPNIIMRLEKDGIISFINYSYANKTPKELIGNQFYNFVSDEYKDLARTTIEKVFKTGQKLSFENIELSGESDDEVKWYQNNVSPVLINGKVEAVNMIAMDITDLKEMDIMRNEFIASISHEIRTPLTIIRESLSLLESGITGELNKEQNEIVVPCLSEVDRLSRTINNLLDITKIEGEKIKLRWDRLNLVYLTESVLNSFRHKAENKNIALEFSTELSEIMIYCDRDRIIQVLINLIGNAVKFTDRGFVRVSIEDKDDEVTCKIADSGRGIDEEDLGTVFDRFHQVGKVMRAGEAGSGLGLTISKGIVKLHKGKIWVNSTINVGSEFFFSLPKTSTEEFIKQNIKAGIDKAKSDLTKMSLLFLHINNYEILKKSFGQEVVDKTRDTIFSRIENEIAGDDFIHRKGENEFVVLSSITKQNMVIVVSKIKSIMDEILAQYEEAFSVEVSTAIAVYPDDGDNADKLIKVALSQLDFGQK